MSTSKTYTGNTASVTFPVAFKNTNYAVVALPKSEGAWVAASFRSYNTTSCAFYPQGNTSDDYWSGIKWIAMGYA